jgi:hypothetical protein
MRKSIAAGVLALSLLPAACKPADTPHLNIQVISSQPHMVTAGDALIEITATAALKNLLVTINGAIAPVSLHQTGGSDRDPESTLGSYRALLSELPAGESIVQVSDGSHTAQLTLVNYPATGPVFSGPHQSPYFCLAELRPTASGAPRRFAIGNGEFLDGTEADENCSLPTRRDYVYRSATQDGFVPLRDMTVLPADVLMTTTRTGAEVPFIVLIETGTLNRAIYQIAVLHDPRMGEPSAFSPAQGWNGRLVYNFGGGCEPGYFQGSSTAGVLRESSLALGYANASSTLNVNAQGGCNDVLSAETAMMVKERFTEQFGAPLYTIGTGGSGGAMQQLLIAGAYPGILDGIIPSMTFSDAVTYMTDSQECSLLLRRFVNDDARDIPDEVKAVIGGWPNWYLCNESLGLRPDRVSPYDCSTEIPEAARYDALSNPNGARCSIYDGMRNVFGERLFSEINAERPFAASPHDNVGVQYGLMALNAGLIDKSLFLDLNEFIGGWDIDFTPVPERMRGDDEAIRIAYETGRVTSGAAGLAHVPIIDDRVYLDHQGNFHASVYSFTTRARLERDNGHADNYVIRRHSQAISLADENLALMDDWLDAIHRDKSPGSMLERIVRMRPASLVDDCFTDDGERIVEVAQFDMDALFGNVGGRCNSLYPPHAGLRLVAGGPLSNDILKCELKPLDFGDYRVEFTAQERERLQRIFPEGICDWEAPGVHQAVNQTWLSFGPSPVNRYAGQRSTEASR